MYTSRQVKVIQGKWVDVCGASQWMREERTVIQDEQGVQARGKEIDKRSGNQIHVDREREEAFKWPAPARTDWAFDTCSNWQWIRHQ